MPFTTVRSNIRVLIRTALLATNISLMSPLIQDRSITIIHNGKPITWRPRDQIALPTVPTPAPIPEEERAVSNIQQRNTRKKGKLPNKLQRCIRRPFPTMKKEQGQTKVLVTGVNTWSTNKHSFISWLKFWKQERVEDPQSPCEGCASWKVRLGSEPQNQSTERNDVSTNPRRESSIDLERETLEGAERMVGLSDTSIPRSAPTPIPSSGKSSRRCCSQRGEENQQDGNIGLDVKDAALIKASSVSDSIVNIIIEEGPKLPSSRFSLTEESLPEDGQRPSLERKCCPIYEEDMSDLEIPAVGKGCTGLSSDHVHVPNDSEVLLSSATLYAADPNLEVELQDAMESSLPHPESVPETATSSAAPQLETAQDKEEGSEISLAESFSRTRSSLSSHDGHSAPSHSFYIERPYSHLGSDFVDVEEEYLTNPSSSFPLPSYPALDSSATSEDFGFRPTCEHMPGSWPEESTCQEISTNETLIPRGWEDLPPNAERLLTSDLESPQGFIVSKEEMLKSLEQNLPPPPDFSLIFSRCRPVPSITQDELPPSPVSLSVTDSEFTTSVHLRGGGGDEARYSFFRPVGKGKLVGNVERGKALLDEQVSGSYLIGGWGRNETWREFCEKMEKRVDKRKQVERLDAEIEKLKAEKKNLETGENGEHGEESEGALKALLAKAKGLFAGGKESGEKTTGEVEVVAAEQTTVKC
jgi:hypothetical protein